MNLRAALAAALLLALSLCPPASAQSEPPAAPSAEKAKAAAPYDETADARQQIAAALARATRENRRVLIQWGGNWCPWCLRLEELYRTDKALRRTLLYEYDLVLVDAGKKGKNVELAKSYGAAVDKNGFPFLTVLAADGTPIANQETDSLEVKGEDGKSVGVAAGHDPAAVLRFLKDHQAPYPAASEVLAHGLAEAKAGGKKVFLHFGAPWCPYCRKLDAWMARPEIENALAKDFVDVKIDVDRTAGGSEVLARYNADAKKSGIPWFVFLDGEGKALADSTMTGGANTGFPVAPEEIAHFEGMLKKSAAKLSAEETARLVASLREEAKKMGH